MNDLGRRTVFTRRELLKSAGGVMAGAILLPLLPGCRNEEFIRALPFGGKVRGEDYRTGHSIRDGSLSVQFPPPEGKILDVVIAGAGPAGLATAWKLSRSGCESFIAVEKEDVVGGLCRGEEQDGIEYACGAHYVDYPRADSGYLIELYADLGVVDGFFPDGNPRVIPEFLVGGNEHRIFSGGTWYPDTFPSQAAGTADAADYERFSRETFEWTTRRGRDGKRAFGYPIAACSADPEIRSLDEISMEEYLKIKGYSSLLLKWHVNDRVLDEYGTPLENCSAWAGLQFFSASRTGFRSMIPDGELVPSLITWPRGLGHLTSAMEKRLPSGKILKKSYVIRMENHQSETRENLVRTVTFSPATRTFRTFLSRFGVLALPKNQATYLVPELKSSRSGDFSNLSYVSWLVATICLKRLPEERATSIAWENLIHDSWTLGYVDNAHQLPRVNKPGARDRRVMTVYCTFPNNPSAERHELLSYGWEYWAKLITNELARAHPGIEGLIEWMDIWKWGHPMLQTTVDSIWGEKRRRMAAPQGRILMSHADICGIPVFEEAAYRGVEVAEEIMKTLGRTFNSSLGTGTGI